MRLSTKGRYGTRAILEIAKHFGETPIKRKEIVLIQKIPDSYLENILITLKAAGLIQTIRGAHGGYQLTRAPATITVLQVVEALEGTIVPVYCIDTQESNCPRSGSCTTQPIWNELYQAMREVLNKYTLEDLLTKEREAERIIDYVI